MQRLNAIVICALFFTGASHLAMAADLIEVKRMNAELAGEIAERAVLACRENGYPVSAVVVDRGGNPQAMLRDVFASR
ncbi:heme-binding protein [Halochromatium glycolicum]|uniref:Heme-binding protein n=1 Tax=Halochromatium glycolicum TaxID=85075 RepID=A0AAJ0X9R3_9GAMM|nr:heme-binding protein [Halochromatium glycolicum]MBK1704493.1 hypothetical protein [Halochromatium glycolicum]